MREVDMKRQTHTHRPLSSRRPRGALLAACALLLVLGGTAPASAQLPGTDPPGYPGSTVYSSIFDLGSAGSVPTWWEPATWTPGGNWGNWELRADGSIGELDGPCPGYSGRWTQEPSYYLRENGSSTGSEGQSILFPWATLYGLPFPTNPASDFMNVRVEVDFYLMDDPESEMGIVLRGADLNAAQSSRVVDHGYLFRIWDIPDDTGSNRAKYELVKRVDMTDYVVASGVIDTSADPGWPAWSKESVHEDFCYRLRVDYYCGYIRAQVKQFNCTGAACDETGWHTVVEWTDDFTTWGPELAVGTGKTGWIGIYSGNGSSSVGERNFFDNFDIWSWGDTCGTPVPTFTPTGTPGPTSTPTPTPIPGATDTPTATPPPIATATPTPTPNDGWSAFNEVNRENVAFKLLYEGSLLDYQAVPDSDEPRIDVAFQPPDAGDIFSYCDGWQLLVDLPDPIMTSELDKVRSYLEKTSTSISYVHDDDSNFLRWDKNFDETDGSPTYDPVPMAASGYTPINNALLDAWDWYVDQVKPEGRWADDPLAECRKWYVVLITDGAESCSTETRPDGTGGGFACDAGNAADHFNSPTAYGAEAGVEGIPVFTIGFAGTAALAPPQLTCISEKTKDHGAEYYGATNASELRDALYEVLNQLNTDDERSFSPFKVSPPPSSRGGPAIEQDFLVVYPLFQPIDESSLWRGNLFGFKLNKDQTTLPADAECEVDRTEMVVTDGKAWDAAARLADQLGVASPVRPVLMGRLDAGVWYRHDLTEVPSDTDLQDYLKTLMDEPGVITNLELQEVVNFVRGLWMDDDGAASPDPIDWDSGTAGNQARPAGAPNLGDFYHSQPTIVSPPSRSMFFFDYGFGAAHDYPAFMTKHEKRRRVVLVGGNDGLLHAFDGGIWDRNRIDDREDGDFYHEQHDLGDGSELFTYLPHAVAPRLYEMTYGDYQQYMVDGPIAVSDVFIDHDGDTNREWRTVALVGMRRGGRGLSALDITQPDPLDGDFVPDEASDQFPGCLDGTGCDDEYPKVLWEFADTSDADGNTYDDLGWTWSKPAIARIAIYNGVDENDPDDVFVAFFGGGWSKDQVLHDNGTPLDPTDDYLLVDTTGRHLYAVDIETGAVLKKWAMGEYGIPGSPTALDSDIDGFHDRIYFGDSDGGVFRLEYPGPKQAAATGVDLGALHRPKRIFDFRPGFTDGGFPDRQQFFTRPVMVPALFGGSGYTWALAMGTGDRANLEVVDENLPIDHFFFLLDYGDDTTRGRDDLVAVDYTDVDGTVNQCAGQDSALEPENGKFGWYLNLRPNEKVVFDASVINGHVLFPTFDPTPGVFAEHNAPDECATASATPEPTNTPDPAGGPPALCAAAGLGRAYDLWFECGLGDYSENNDVYTGVEDYTIGGTTYVTYTESHITGGETEEFPNVTGHVVTNWRQD
jgi:hypothetical protein